jgi:type II secretory pathway component PulC
MGYLGYNTYMTFFYTVPDVANTAGPKPTVASSSDKPELSQSTISGYNAIWQRDLFHVTAEEDRNENEKESFATLAYADKDVGIVLLGTIVSDDPELSRAIIGDLKGKKQEAYREGDAVGKYQIKKIMLGKVIISTEDGNKLLAVLHKNDRRDPDIIEDEMGIDEEPFEETSLRKRRSVGKQRKVRRRRARVNHLEASEE